MKKLVSFALMLILSVALIAPAFAASANNKWIRFNADDCFWEQDRGKTEQERMEACRMVFDPSTSSEEPERAIFYKFPLKVVVSEDNDPTAWWRPVTGEFKERISGMIITAAGDVLIYVGQRDGYIDNEGRMHITEYAFTKLEEYKVVLRGQKGNEGRKPKPWEENEGAGKVIMGTDEPRVDMMGGNNKAISLP
ncbi:hypothetical protein ACFL3M_00885 [Patescibacteria group bacterium]